MVARTEELRSEYFLFKQSLDGARTKVRNWAPMARRVTCCRRGGCGCDCMQPEAPFPTSPTASFSCWNTACTYTPAKRSSAPRAGSPCFLCKATAPPLPAPGCPANARGAERLRGLICGICFPPPSFYRTVPTPLRSWAARPHPPITGKLLLCSHRRRCATLSSRRGGIVCPASRGTVLIP